ncbi:Putative uncharacterized serine/threonine-protein kinase SgK110 [Tupaia chinensis]|uniref:Uncharacterized serine/threonine-protein kinase SgK110 n=1 Tax=Tupaia chinensis TaxID=246437 RepID=L9KQK1_TUPCH|nr:Putative uncharacterized serine/threonine-protein kinase SgK110 [Tupaia chinensis]
MELRDPETPEDGDPEEDTAGALQRLVGLPAPRVATLRSLCSQYRLIRKLGSGSYGRGLLAQPRRGGPAVALKLLRRDSVLRTTFLREFCVGRCVSSHPGLLQTLAGPLQTPRHFAFAQEFAPYGDLSGMLQERGLPELLVKRVVAQLAGALDFLHGRGLVHADVKPDNVLVFDPACSRVALGDLEMPGRQSEVQPVEARAEASEGEAEEGLGGLTCEELRQGQEAALALEDMMALSAQTLVRAEVEELYQEVRPLGQGRFGRVLLVTHRQKAPCLGTGLPRGEAGATVKKLEVAQAEHTGAGGCHQPGTSIAEVWGAPGGRAAAEPGTPLELKQLPKTSTSARGFLYEFCVGLSLGAHPNIVTAYGIGLESVASYSFLTEPVLHGDLISFIQPKVGACSRGKPAPHRSRCPGPRPAPGATRRTCTGPTSSD